MDSFSLLHAELVEFGPSSVGRTPKSAVLFTFNSKSWANHPVNRSHTASHSLLKRPARFGWKKYFLNSNKIFLMNGILLRFQRVFLWSKITHISFNCSPTGQKRKQIKTEQLFSFIRACNLFIPARIIPDTYNKNKKMECKNQPLKQKQKLNIT